MWNVLTNRTSKYPRNRAITVVSILSLLRQDIREGEEYFKANDIKLLVNYAKKIKSLFGDKLNASIELIDPLLAIADLKVEHQVLGDFAVFAF
jgi:hypothetical protein